MLTLRIAFLCATGEVLVARCTLESPYWSDDHERASGTWSLALPKWEWVQLLWTLVHAPQAFLKVEIKNEALACQ